MTTKKLFTLLVPAIFLSAPLPRADAQAAAAGQLDRAAGIISVYCGGTDDSAAIAAAASTSGTYVFPLNGTCVINGPASPWTTPNISWNLNGTTIKHKAADTTHYMLDFGSGANNIQIRNGTLDYNGVIQSGTGTSFFIHFNAGTGIVMEDVTFVNSGTD